ncbi:unnamed protein product [Rodentolepis nana]|uniref:PH domain-containing protein n=1 Tax=Rodentolepis nana TaxID=102285 RepID=A0A0R3T4K6_RODNA|nr:unnamed protein product [Rodentolepis nana]
MSSDCITIPVNGKDLWSSLNYNESLRFSPKFRLALRVSEYEVETLQSRYKEAVGMFVRTNKAGEIFADALNGLCRCLNNLVTPKALKKSITMYDAEAANQAKPVSNGVYPSPSAEKAIRYEGFLFKRSKKKRWRTWVRRWFMVTDNRLVYFSSFSDTFTSLTWKILEPDLRLCTAKAVITDRRFVFELISPTGKVHYLQAESAEALEKWVSVLRSGIINSTSTNGELKLSNAMMCSSLSGSRDSLRSLSGVLLLDEPPSAGNRLCADCLTSHEVKWASTNLGVTLCTDCAACHRSLGVHISKVSLNAFLIECASQILGKRLFYVSNFPLSVSLLSFQCAIGLFDVSKSAYFDFIG